MSLIHKIIPTRPLDFTTLNKALRSPVEITCDYRGAKTCYYWVPGKSARGMDITIEEGYIEVRNTILSNSYDYLITNVVAEHVLALTGGTITDEYDDPVDGWPLFDEAYISKREQNDCESFKAVLSQTNDIVIYGPVRKVYFGKRINTMISGYNGIALKEKMFDIILKSQWGLPDYGYGNIAEVGNEGEDKMIFKILTPHTDCLIDKYDRILLDREPARPIMITNDILNGILPDTWTRIDDFTVVAPRLGDGEWKALIDVAQPYDMFDEWMEQRKGKH